MSMRIIGFDTETYYDNDISVVTLGAWKYARHPMAGCYMISVSDGEEHWAGEPKDFNFASLDGQIVVSHNRAFDEEIYLGHHERGLWPKISPAEWHCTADMSSYLCNRRSLADASEFLLGETPSKTMRNYMKGRTWADAQADGKAEQLLEYARTDARLCQQLFAKHGHRWPEWERRLSDLTIKQGRTGVRLDVEKLEEGKLLLERVVLASQDLLPWVTRDGKKPASRPAMVEECRRMGIPPPPVKAHDPDGNEDWEEEWSPKVPWVKALKDLRKAKKTLATINTMLLRKRDDGTMAFSLKYWGAHTGRWSGDGGVNFQNFARNPLKISDQYQIIDE